MLDAFTSIDMLVYAWVCVESGKIDNMKLLDSRICYYDIDAIWHRKLTHWKISMVSRIANIIVHCTLYNHLNCASCKLVHFLPAFTPSRYLDIGSSSDNFTVAPLPYDVPNIMRKQTHCHRKPEHNVFFCIWPTDTNALIKICQIKYESISQGILFILWFKSVQDIVCISEDILYDCSVFTLGIGYCIHCNPISPTLQYLQLVQFLNKRIKLSIMFSIYNRVNRCILQLVLEMCFPC